MSDQIHRIEPPTKHELAELDAMRAANEERINRLAVQGLPIDLNGGLLDHLIDEVIPEGTWWRHDFCVRWETRAGVLLDGIEKQVREARFLGPG